MNNTDLPEEIYNNIFNTGLRLYHEETLLMRTKGYAQLQYKRLVEDKIVKQFSNNIVTKEKIRHILGKKNGRRLYKKKGDFIKKINTNVINNIQIILTMTPR